MIQFGISFLTIETQQGILIKCEELFKIINNGEDSEHQFKQNFSSIDNLAVEISAFANSDGGMILIGVSDDGKLTGLRKDDIKKLNQWISNATTNKIDKQIVVKTTILNCDEKRVLLIRVPRGPNKPYAVNRTDVWVKHGADKRKAPIEQVLRLAQTSGLVYADEIETEAILEEFDFDFFEKRYQKYYQDDISNLDIPIEKLLVNTKLAKNDKLTLAGLLLCGKDPGYKRPQFGIKATFFDGNEIHGPEYKDAQDIRGKLVEQFEQAVSFVKRNLRRVQKNSNFNAPGVLEIPQDAFSEIIGNAIVHRNYYINAPIQIHLFDNRLEIQSPGNLPNTINEENIKYGVHIKRNPTILSFLEKDPQFSYSGRGSGIPRVIKTCQQMNNQVKFINDSGKQVFKVIFPR